MAEKLDVQIKKPRSCGRQKNRENVEADTAETYYRRACSIPFVDHLIEELSRRFTDGQQQIIPLAHAVIPDQMNRNNQWRQDFIQFTEKYSDDLPSPTTLNAELDIWERMWKKKCNVPSTAQSTIKETNRVLFPNIYTILPVTTCECERSVSALRRLKSYMRTTMGQERLNGLALLHVHYTRAINIDQVVDIFAREHPHRMALLDILNTD